MTRRAAPRPAVLVVEDEADLAATYRRLLGHHGFRVVTAATRDAGLRALDDETFAAAIIDVRLPDGDGLDVVRKARTLVPPAPAIVVTGFPLAHVRQAARTAGAAHFLAKPFEVADLVARVRTLVDAQRAAEA
jgi:DNA-binding response OmpR family regulator